MLYNAASKEDRLVPNFSLWEMANKDDGGALLLTPGSVRHALMMQELRAWYNKPMTINSWYRTPAYNKKVGGSSNSCHIHGIATDVALPGLTSQQIQNFRNKWEQICEKWNVFGGIGIYSWGLHFDSNDGTAYRQTAFRIKDYR